MYVVIKGLSYDEVYDYLEDALRDVPDWEDDINIDDYGYVDAAGGDMRRHVEIDAGVGYDWEDLFVEAIEDLADEEPDAEINYL